MSVIDFDHHHADEVEKEAVRDQSLRETDIVWNEAYGGYWVVARFEHVAAIVRDHKRFSSAAGVNHPSPVAIPALPIEADEPMHREYRKVLIPLVTAERVATFEPSLRQYIADILERAIADDRPWDVVDALALPLPVRAAAAMLGIGPDDFDDFERAVVTMNAVTVQGNEEDQRRAIEGAFAMFKLGFARARTRPSTELDLFSMLVNARVDGRAMTDDELLGMALTTSSGATSTTTEAIGFIFYHLAASPALFARISIDPSLIDRLVEEVLRIDSPVWRLFRTVLEPVSIGGVDMKVGDKVMLAFGWANHDEQRYVHPDQIELDEKRPTHLAFSAGVHRCVGLHSARLQLRLIVEELLRCADSVQLASPPAPPRSHFSTRGFDELKVWLTGRDRALADATS
jgi:cytochrome P450